MLATYVYFLIREQENHSIAAPAANRYMNICVFMCDGRTANLTVALCAKAFDS